MYTLRMTRLFACLLLAVSQIAVAQVYPAKPVRLVVGLAPGGATDIMARTLAPALGEELGQPVVVDNRPGAAGSIGAAAVAKAAPDGYTLFLASSSFTSNAVLQQNGSYDPIQDFEPITNVASGPFLLVVRNSLPVSSVQELIAYAKNHPGKLNYASSGIGSTAHLTGELLKRTAGIEMTHISYRGAGPALADVLGGQVDMMFASIVSSLHHAKGGKLKALAVTSAKRSAVVPEFPTVAEAGVPGFETIGYFGLLAPARTPPAIVGTVHAAVQRAIKRRDVVERIAADGAEPDGCSPTELRALLEKDMKGIAEITRGANIQR
jgi:tripartite-type tricarboxylate transporter receptor subunit TctC